MDHSWILGFVCAGRRRELAGAPVRRPDVPGGMDLVPVVVSVEHPRPDDSYMCSTPRSDHVTSRARTEAGRVFDVDRVSGRAAGLVTGHDLYVQAALTAVGGVQHVSVVGIRLHYEAHVAVGGLLPGSLDDCALERDAGAEHLKAIGAVHPVVGVSLAGATPNGVCLPHTRSGR